MPYSIHSLGEHQTQQQTFRNSLNDSNAQSIHCSSIKQLRQADKQRLANMILHIARVERTSKSQRQQIEKDKEYIQNLEKKVTSMESQIEGYEDKLRSSVSHFKASMDQIAEQRDHEQHLRQINAKRANMMEREVKRLQQLISVVDDHQTEKSKKPKTQEKAIITTPSNFKKNNSIQTCIKLDNNRTKNENYYNNNNNNIVENHFKNEEIDSEDFVSSVTGTEDGVSVTSGNDQELDALMTAFSNSSNQQLWFEGEDKVETDLATLLNSLDRNVK